jgi:hypothetical protein
LEILDRKGELREKKKGLPLNIKNMQCMYIHSENCRHSCLKMHRA